MRGIAEMFAELDGSARYEEAIEIALTRRRARENPKDAVERMRVWRKLNPKKARAQLKRSRDRWKKRYPEKVRAARKRKHENAKKRNLDAVRALWRKHAAAYRARKKRASLAVDGNA